MSLDRSLLRLIDLVEERGQRVPARGVPAPQDSYYRSVHWQTTRAAALERAEHRCQLCGRRPDHPLLVHHNNYGRLWAERPADLVVLCRGCHNTHHRRHPAPKDIPWATERRSP